MIQVCDDTEFNGEKTTWFFENGRYIKKNKNDTVVAAIAGEYLPDPDELWKNRCKSIGAEYPSVSTLHPKTGKAIRLKPSEATFELFDHWEKNNANINH